MDSLRIHRGFIAKPMDSLRGGGGGEEQLGGGDGTEFVSRAPAGEAWEGRHNPGRVLGSGDGVHKVLACVDMVRTHPQGAAGGGGECDAHTPCPPRRGELKSWGL